MKELYAAHEYARRRSRYDQIQSNRHQLAAVEAAGNALPLEDMDVEDW